MTDLIIKKTHEQYHAGIQMILYATRQRVWILDDRNQTRKCDHAYVPDSTPIQLIIKWVIYQLFEYIARSLSITLEKISTDHSISKKRKSESNQDLRVRVVCMAVKDVHLEIVSDMTTDFSRPCDVS